MNQKINPYYSFPVFFAFLCMGFGDMVGPLTGLIKQDFELSNLMAQMIPFMGFLMFGVLSIPLGIIQDKFGRKTILLTGLLLALIGLVIPYAAQFSSYLILLFGILMIGAGAAFMQVSGNPMMRDVSAQGRYARNLSLAQFIKAIGSLSGALIPLIAVNYWGADWKILFPIYSSIILVTFIWLWAIKVREKDRVKVFRATFASNISLLKNRFVMLTVIGIFLYVGAEVSMSSGLPIFLQDSYGFDIARLGLLGTLFFFIALMAGRLAGAIILNWISPGIFLKISVFVALAGFLGLFSGVQPIAISSIILLGLGFANIFPLIFSIAVEAMPERSNELSGLMVTAIVGGAIIPPLMGLVADYTSQLIGFFVPIACILFIVTLSFIIRSVQQSSVYNE